MNKILKRTLQVGLPVLLVGVMIALKAGENKPDKESGNAKDKNRSKQEIPVNAVIIKPQNLNASIDAVGTLLPNEEVDLIVETAGKVTGIFFKEGQRVKKGDLLIKVDDSDLQAQLTKARFQRKLLGEKLERQRTLFQKEAVSREAFDQVQTDFNLIEADIALLEIRISKTEILAPFGGIIGFRGVSPGSYIQPNTIVSRLIDDNQLKIEFSIPEKYVRLPLLGSTAKFRTEATDEEYTATVYAVNPKIDVQTRTLSLRAICDNTDNRLPSGMFARLNLITSSTDNALMLPTEAIVPEMEGKIVWKIENGQAHSVAVETGQRTDRLIEVISGITAGDTILTSGLMQIRPGMAVRPSIIE